MADLRGEAWHREQQRRSQDLIRVLNPTEEDYILTWDREKFIIPGKNKDTGWGKGMRVMQRYLAEKYVREMKDKMILSKADTKLEEIKEKLAKNGAADISFNANMQLSGVQGVRSDDPVLTEKYYDMLWLGIEVEYGTDTMSTIADQPMIMGSERDVLDKIGNKRYSQKVEETVKEEPPKTYVEHTVPSPEPDAPPIYISKKDRERMAK